MVRVPVLWMEAGLYQQMSAALAYARFACFLARYGAEREYRRMLRALLNDYYTARQNER